MNAPRFSLVTPEASDRDTFLPPLEMGETLREAWLKLLRNRRLFALFFVLSLVGSVYYVLTAEAQYTANGSLLIDPREGEALDNRPQSISAIGSLDELTVDSELRVLTSREVTSQTMLALDVANRFGQGGRERAAPSLRQRLQRMFGIDAATSQAMALPDDLKVARRLEAERRSFVKGLSAERAGDSYVIDITYTSPDLAFSAEAVNTLMQEYLRASGQRQRQDVERTRDWLSERIEALQISVRDAETAVATFRSEHELVALPDKLLPSEVALNAAVEELIRLRGDVLVVDVQVQQLTEQIAQGEIEAVQVPLEERSNALNEFQTRFAELLREETELLLNWSEDSSVVVGLRQQQDQMRSLILNEYRQVRDRLAARRDALARQLSAIETVIEDMRGDYSDNIQRSVELLNLEREANAKRQLYEQLLEEFNSSSQLLTFEGTSARVIAWAVPPDKKSAPQSRQIVVLAVFGAMVLAMGVVIVREAFDGSFRTQDDVSHDLGLNYLGLVPNFASEFQADGLIRPWTLRFGSVASHTSKNLSRAGQRLGFAIREPSSVSAETMRAMHVQLKLQREKSASVAKGNIIGFTSTTQGEGKTTVAFNFASFLAQQNERVVIVDLDVANWQMSRLIDPLLPESNDLSKLIDLEPDSVARIEPIPEFPNLAVIANPKNTERPVTMMQDQAHLDALLARLRDHFDVIVLDLPPVQGVADTRLLAKLCHRLIYTVRWGVTQRSHVKWVFQNRLLPTSRIMGVVFSRANIRKYRLFNQNEIMDYDG
ncbi:MAG: polysaccharide biosynthesis tyrosine autokinase [Pseudomonadota bacterium]